MYLDKQICVSKQTRFSDFEESFIIGRTWMISVLKITNLFSKNLKFVIGGKLISELIA